jgi:hypothetical protein
MTQSAFDIDRIVREVMRELGLSVAEAPAPVAAATPVAPVVQPTTVTGDAAVKSDQLVVSQPVITLSALAGRLEGIKQVLVPPGAVVTPAVHDELYRRNVTLAFASAEVAERRGALRLVMVTTGKRFDPAALIGAIRGAALEVESVNSDCLMAASERLAAEVAKENTLGALVTRHTAAALCLANRLAGVRAIHTNEAGRVAAFAESVGANVLVLDPQNGLFALKRIVTEFCRDGVRECPDVFRKKLG